MTKQKKNIDLWSPHAQTHVHVHLHTYIHFYTLMHTYMYIIHTHTISVCLSTKTVDENAWDNVKLILEYKYLFIIPMNILCLCFWMFTSYMMTENQLSVQTFLLKAQLITNRQQIEKT